jgi:hypothetical protein
MKRSILVMFACVFIIAACGGSKSSSSADQNATWLLSPEYAGLTNRLGPQAADEGRVFKTNCRHAMVHRSHGDGPAGQALDPRPRNLAEIQSEVGDDFLFWRIREGKPGTSMVAWKGILTDEQIWQTVSFIRTLQ